jgi:hypothetical protein
LFATLPAVLFPLAPVPGIRVGLLACLLVALGAAAGCKRGAKTPEEAYHRLVEAVKAKDPDRLYRALDLETRWSWMTIRRSHREAYDILLSNLPEGPERDRATRRFEAGALSEDEASLFREHLTDERWHDLGAGLDGVAPTLRPVPGPEQENEVQAELTPGRSLRFRRGPDGRWGFTGFAALAEEEKRRAIIDLEIIRSNAADLERAASRAGK